MRPQNLAPAAGDVPVRGMMLATARWRGLSGSVTITAREVSGGAAMHFHDLYVDDAGASHWRSTDVVLEERSFAPPAEAIEVSDTWPATGLVFLRLAQGWNEPIHPTPVVQTLVCLRGAVRVTASDGEAREIGPGDVWRMADTHGQGHHTEVISACDFECVITQHG